MEKTGYTLTSGATSEGVVLNVAFAFPDAEAALEFEKTLGGKAKKGEKAKPEKAEKPAKGKGSKKAKDEDEDDEDEEESDDDEDEDEEEESDDEDEDDEDSDDDDEDDEDEKPAKGKGKKGKDDDEGSSTVKLTPALKKATKLREVIVELMNQGLKGQKIVDACVALKGKLAVLKPIKDLETRVPRAVDLIKKK